MCFSAQASFVAGVSLSVAGVATLRVARKRSEIPFAMIPLLFGLQQLTEGAIWLTFGHDTPLLQLRLTWVYSTFSHVLWPIYVPFAIGFLENNPWRKRTIGAFQVIGITVGLYLLYWLAVGPVVAEVVDRHIVYLSPHFHVMSVMVLYLAATCVSCFFSSHRFVNLFGVLALLSFITAYFVEERALVSIWCFFAAILSLLVYLHLRYRSLGGFPHETDAPSEFGEPVISL